MNQGMSQVDGAHTALQIMRNVMMITLLSGLSSSTTLAKTFSLERVVSESLSRHPSVSAKRFEIQAARRGLTAAQSLFSPQVSGEIDLMDDLVTIPNPLEMGARTPIETQRYSAELRLSQPLRWGTVFGFGLRQSQIETTNPFRNCVPGIVSDRCFESTLTLSLDQPLLRGRSSTANTSEERSASYALSSAKAQLRSEVNRQIQAVASLYLQLSLAQAQHHLEREQLRLTERRLDEAKERLNLGLIAASDLYPLQAAIARQAQALMSRQGRLDEVRMQLEGLSGLDVTEASKPDQWLLAARLDRFSGDLTAVNLQETPQAIALKTSARQLGARRATLLDAERPQLNLGLVWSQSGLGEALDEALGALPDNESRFYGVTLRFSQAISNRADQQSAQLESQLKAREAEYESLIRELSLERSRLITSVDRKRRMLKLAREASIATRRNHEAASAKYREGRTTLFEVLELQNQALASQTQALVIEYEISQALIDAWALSDQLIDRFGLELK